MLVQDEGWCGRWARRVTVLSVLVYASVVRIVVWDESSQSLLVGKLCRIGMA